MQAYTTLRHPGQAEIVVNKSRFLCDAAPAETEEAALTLLQSVKERYRDARHHCYAYLIGQNAGIMRYSDDGEPGGTAGMPILDVLRKNGLVNCCAVVTRYFGGILLGTGGLVRAYTQATVEGIKAAGIVTMEPTVTLLCEVAYPLWDRVQHRLRSLPVQCLEPTFTTAIVFTLLVRQTDEQRILQDLTQLCDGRFDFLREGESWQAWERMDTNVP